MIEGLQSEPGHEAPVAARGGHAGSMAKLLDPTSIAVVGASQHRGRGARVLINLRNLGFAGDVFAVHPKFDEVHGYPCVPTVAALPRPVDCVVAAVSADVACDV